MESKSKTLLIDTIYDIIGSIFLGMGIYSFAKNANFAPGGLSGISLILNYIFNLPIGTLTMTLNIPLIIISYKVLGKNFLLKSMKTIFINTIILDYIFPHLPMYKGLPITASIFTGIFTGLGCALIYMRGSSTGGIDFIVMSIKQKKPHLSVGQIVLVINTAIVLVGGAVYKNVDAILYGVVANIITTIVMDKVMIGVTDGKLLLIIIDKQYGKPLSNDIFELIHRGATLMDGKGSYSGTSKEIVLCACSNVQISAIKSIAYKYDPKAIVMITNTNEVIGEGFVLPEMTAQ